MRRLTIAGLVALGCWGVASLPPADAAPVSCDVVRCAPCPEGFRILFKPNNCCRCVPIPNGGPLG
jgi:hypothetical protein